MSIADKNIQAAKKNHLLKMKQICKSFSANQILYDVDFDLKYGEVHALIGENGAGKSTLIKVLAGIHKPEKGEICIDGEPIQIDGPSDAFRHGISTIHQEFNLVPELDIAANIFLGREKMSKPGILDKSKAYREAEKLLAMISASLSPDQKIKNLGVAEKQMVEICKALSLDARIIIMDEPTAVLSQKEIDQLFKIIQSLVERNVSVIYISHRLEELTRIADRVSVMRDGHMIATIDKKEEIVKENITRMMIGRELSEQYPKKDRELGSTLLEVRHLSQKGVLKDISFTLRTGEILGFSGLVGSGRTELARAIMGIDKIDEGEILLENKVIQHKSAIKSKKDGIVMIPEERKTQGLVIGMNIEDNIILPYLYKLCSNGILNWKKLNSLIEGLMHDFSIHPNNQKTIVKQMSGGNQQKVSIAKWVYEKPKVIIFDEPTRGVDVGAKEEIYHIMQDIAKEGVGIIMISSELPEIMGMSDRTYIMKEGRITGELDKAEFDEQRILQCAF